MIQFTVLLYVLNLAPLVFVRDDEASRRGLGAAGVMAWFCLDDWLVLGDSYRHMGESLIVVRQIAGRGTSLQSVKVSTGAITVSGVAGHTVGHMCDVGSIVPCK